jgi:L-threonylcarbamoyladenylate synthase
MKIVQANKQGIKEAISILKQGGVIVYPTETAYGLGADFLNPQAVKKIYRIKGRAFNKPLSVLVGSLSMAKKLVKFDGLSQSLAKRHWPGPLTLVLEIKNQKNQESNKLKIKNLKLNKNSKFKTCPEQSRGIQNYQTLGLRISSNRLATTMVKKFGGPITSTSANLAGHVECYSAAAVIKQLAGKKDQPDLIIDAGELPRQGVSTVVKIEDGQVKVLRKGKILPPSVIPSLPRNPINKQRC